MSEHELLNNLIADFREEMRSQFFHMRNLLINSKITDYNFSETYDYLHSHGIKISEKDLRAAIQTSDLLAYHFTVETGHQPYVYNHYGWDKRNIRILSTDLQQFLAKQIMIKEQSETVKNKLKNLMI